MTNWKPGMKAICVSNGPYSIILAGPKVYEVDDTKVCLGALCLRFLGPIRSYELAERFRPLLGDEQEQLTAIEEEVKLSEPVLA